MNIRDGIRTMVLGAVAIGSAVAAQAQSLSPDQYVSVARAVAAQEPMTNKTVPVWSLEAFGLSGTYWMLQTDTPPLPYNPFPELPVVAVATNIFLVDDRSVDYPALAAEQNEVFALRSLSGSGGLMTMNSGVPELPGEGGRRRGHE